MALANFTLDRGRLIQVGVPFLLGLLGCLLPALTITSLNEQVEPVTSTGRLWAAAELARALDPQVMPSFYTGADPAGLGLWLNVLSIAFTLQQIGLLVGLCTLVALLMDEINSSCSGRCTWPAGCWHWPRSRSGWGRFG